MAPMRRRGVVTAAGVVTLALVGNTASAFVVCPSRGGLRSKAPRALAVRQLQMVGGGPRGRSSAGVSIEGADGAKAVLTSSTTTPIQSMQSMAEYGEDEMVDGAASAGAEQGMEDLQSFTVSDAERSIVANRREATMGRRTSFLMTAAVAAGVGAGAWVAGTTFIKRQTDLVEAYADEMTYHVGDEREMALCHKEYKGKIGPMLYREDMFKAAMLAIGRKRALTLEAVRSVNYIIELFKFSTTKAVKLLVAATRSTERSQTNVRSKLYFMGTLIGKGNAKAERILEPLRKNIESSYVSDGAEMLKVRMDNMAASALKAAIDAVPDDQVLEAGWEELGISDERAAEIAGAMMDESEDLLGVDFYKTGGDPTNDAESDPEAAAMLKQLEDEMEAKKTEPQDEKEPETEGAAKSYECQVCGYKMFVAKGREFKFFGDDFKCPECGAGKNKFIEAEMGDD